MKRLLLLLFLLLPFTVQAQFLFITNNGAITITSYTGSGGDVVIPDATNGYPVKNIGSWAFQCQTNLTNITIPNSVTSIGNSAFYSCTALTNVIISSSVTNIGSMAFLFCSSLTAFTVDAANPAYSSAEGVLFDKNQATLIQYPPSKIGSYTIPSNVSYVGSYSFIDAPA